jgi:hypothetical protein
MTYQPAITDKDKTTVIWKLAHYNTPESRIAVEVLCQELNMPRRKLRAIVHEINSDDSDHLILTDTDEGGYWLAVRGVDPAPAVSHFYEEESRAVNTMRKAHAIRRKIVNLYGQEAIDPNVKLQGRLF